mgnify:CR=1 FL=1
MKRILLVSTLLFSQFSIAISLGDEQDKMLKECQVLLDQIAQSDCGQKTLGFLKNAYIKVGLNISQRAMTFEEKESEAEMFKMIGEWSPSPVLTLSLGDNYFDDSNFGYQLGFSYISDTAYEQEIERNGQTKSVDLLTYSKMSVMTFSPSIFYSFGRGDDTPESYFTSGLGLNAGYSKVKGTAHITNNKEDTTCYNTGTSYLNGSATSDDLMQNCAFGFYEEDGLTFGATLYLAYEYHNWLTELSSSIYTINSTDDFTFSTSDISFSVSRKFGF